MTAIDKLTLIYEGLTADRKRQADEYIRNLLIEQLLEAEDKPAQNPTHA